MRFALKQVKGVHNAMVSMPDKAVVTAADEVKIEDLIKAVKKAGFGASAS
ncbi:MAG TPA: hypothetical protein DEP88_03105 [Verrucomicrobiales bacterium]|nr:hypothetical protein [Verrucomicrobiales bacterium]HCI92603.1 hypothetical protein [Verrucomicrobiales bacterium]HCL97088.1 hypothetical protein [Verrucomicrobiales bacterium]